MVKKMVFVLFLSIFLGFILKGEDCEKAKRYFDQALNIKENEPLGLFKKEQLYKKVIELCPTYAPAFNNLGDVYEKQKRYEEAIAQYKKAMELRPDSPYPYFGLGDVYYKTGRYKEAKYWYEKGLSCENRYKPADDKEREALKKEFALTREYMKSIENVLKDGIIKADTIRAILTPATTRGAGEIVSITFGEELIPFDFDKYNIREDAKPQLNEIGKFLEDLFSGEKSIAVEPNTFYVFEIAGHTDIRGTDEYNLELSKKRAMAVKEYLVRKFNIPEERLVPKGYGERSPLCTEGASEKEETPCNALNRRVEIIRKTGEVITVEGRTSIVTRGRGGIIEQKIILDTGFFYQKGGETLVNALKEGSILHSKSDKYFIFFKPEQDCYVYILQEDSKGNLEILFPEKGINAHVKKGQDYWVPSFGRAFTLDETKGEERIYLLATSSPLDSLIEGQNMENTIKIAVRSFQAQSISTRAIKVVRPKNLPQNITPQEVERLSNMIEQIEGEGGWVRIVRFRHE